MLRIDRSKECFDARALGAAHEQQPAGAQRKMKNVEDSLLRLRRQVDEEVAAGDKVDPRKRGVAQEVMHREKNLLAQLLAHAVAAVILAEKTLEPRRRDVRLDGGGIKTLARLVHRLFVNVARENLERRRRRQALRLFAEKHGQGVGLLAGRAPRHPDPQVILFLPPGEELRHMGFHRRKGFLIPEKMGHANQEIL